MLSLMFSVLGLNAQITTEPTPLMESSENVVIFFHADQGNKGLANLASSVAVYAHTGVITNKSTGDSDWKNAPTWGDNAEKYKCEYVSPNLYKLYIGNIRNYYNITDPTEFVKKLAFVFRTADKSKEGKGEGNKDMFVTVNPDGAHIEIMSNLSSAFAPLGENVTITANATVAGKIEILNGEEVVKSADNVKSLAYTFAATPEGSQWQFRGRLTPAGQEPVVSDPLSVITLTPSAQAVYPGGVPKPGAYWQCTNPAKGEKVKVLFCLPAPQKSSVTVVGNWNNFSLAGKPMYYQDYNGQRYFWQEIDGISWEENCIYYYYVDGKYRVGDPYARMILDPWNDKYIASDIYPNLPQYPYDYINDVSLAVLTPFRTADNPEYEWKVKDFTRPEKENLRIYELLFRDFTGTEGKAYGNGTVRAAIDKIPYLKDLGVNAIELLPITEFNGNISWGYNPNFYFATDKAYGTPNDYKEFIDKCHEAGMAVILDVVFNQSDWQHPWYQMYEVGSNPFYNATAPHAYSVLNDWNQGFPLVQKQWEDVLTYWLTEYNFDGFRFDLVKGLGNNESYANSGDGATNAYNQSRVDRMRALQKVVDSVKPGAYFINENLAGAQEENAMAESGQLNWANVNDAGCQYAMGYSTGSNLSRMYAPLDSRTWGSTVSYLESHDEQRLAYKQKQWGAAAVKNDLAVAMHRLGCCAAQMILSPGAHMIWQFSELGNDQNTKDANGGNNTDPKIVNWEAYWVPERMALYKTYANLHSIRENNPELFAKSAFFESKTNASDWSNGRTMISKAGEKELYTVLNPNVSGNLAVKVTFTSKDNAAYKILCQTPNTDITFDAAAGIVNVPANSFVVIGKGTFSGVENVAAEEEEMPMVYAANGKIVVLTDAPVAVYSLSGARIGVERGDNRQEASVAPGIYVVRVADRAVKVMVK